MFAAVGLVTALQSLGSLLADRGFAYEVVVIGGGGLLLARLIERPTKDLDAIALIGDDKYVLARPLPEPLREAIADVAALLGLADDWLNPGPTDQLKHGLPHGFRERTNALVFDTLVVHVAARHDQIHLKLYAAADAGPSSKHVADLIALEPTSDELHVAAGWVKRQDMGDEFAQFVDAVIAYVEATRGSR